MFGNRTIANVISEDELTLQSGGPLSNMADVLIKSGNLDTKTGKQECHVTIYKPTHTKIASNPTKAREEASNRFSFMTLPRNQHLISNFWPPER